MSKPDEALQSHENTRAAKGLEQVDPALELIYGLNDRPPLYESAFAGIQHLLAIFIGISTPPLIICGVLKFPPHITAFVISMALFASGVSTFIQCKRFGPIGSGLLSIQGTSFTFLGTILAMGFSIKNAGGSPEQILTTIFGVCFACSFIEMIFSRFIPFLRKIITPLVSGIVVTLIGLSLIKVGITDFCGGAYQLKLLTQGKPSDFGSLENIGLAFLVLLLIIIFNRSKNKFVRMSAIVIGLAVGYVVSIFLGKVDFGKLAAIDIFALPMPFKFGFFSFDWAFVVPMALLFLITTVESIGDLTATAMISKQPIEGKPYMKTISGGVLGDGVNSALAAIFNSFPNTTFSQNNGVIQLTGVASRHVGFFIAGYLVLLGVFPVVGGVLSLIPNSVLGGATIIMFGTVAAAGV
ncbi:MAG: purine permease, partial [Desulfobacterales bacterium]|nr:purine permease [Desulfobacterales bacterium]